MTYRISGLSPALFDEYRDANHERLLAMNARRVHADTKPGYPCRITLEDAEPGESLILCNYVSNDVATPYRTAYAIYFREQAAETANYVDELPPVFANRRLSLRSFNFEGMLHEAILAEPDETELRVREMLSNQAVVDIDAHNAAHGCFAARIHRHGENA